MWRIVVLMLPLQLASTIMAAEIDFARDVLPILTRHCVICHMPGDEQGELSLYPDAWGSLHSVPSVQSPLLLVAPGSHEQSYLYHKLLGTHHEVQGSGDRMPFQRDPLSAAELETLRVWIDDGADQN